MRLGNIVNKARRKLDERGGTEALKQDAQQLKDIAKGKGTVSEKAKRAQQAVKEPGSGATQGGPAAGPGGQPPASQSGSATGPGGQPPAPQSGPAGETGPTGVGGTGATPGDGGSTGPGPTATDLPDSEERAGPKGGSSGSSGPQSPA